MPIPSINPDNWYLLFDIILRGALVERTPVLDEARYYANNAMGIDGQQTTDIEALEPHANGHVRQPNAIEKPTAAAAAAANLIDLLSFTDEPTTLSNSSGNALLDLLGGGPMGDANSASSPGTLHYVVLVSLMCKSAYVVESSNLRRFELLLFGF